MERRKILLGSGAALATALAGCSSSDTSDDDESDDSSGSNDDNGNGDNGDNGESHVDDIPGFDGKKLEIDSDAVTIEKVEHKGDKVDIVATTEITDHEKLYAELESLADDHDAATVDHEAFMAEIKTVEWTIDHGDTNVASFTVNVDWIVDYHEGTLSREEFADKVKSTTE